MIFIMWRARPRQLERVSDQFGLPISFVVMTKSRADIEAFVRRIVAEIEAVEAAGAPSPADIAEALNARGVTTRKGRGWTAATVRKFLSSPGAERYRSSGG